MFRFRALFLTVSFLFAHFAIASQSATLPLGMEDFSKKAGTTLEVSKSLPEYTSIMLSNPGVVAEERIVNYDSYRVFGIPGERRFYQVRAVGE